MNAVYHGYAGPAPGGPVAGQALLCLIPMEPGDGAPLYLRGSVLSTGSKSLHVFPDLQAIAIHLCFYYKLTRFHGQAR